MTVDAASITMRARRSVAPLGGLARLLTRALASVRPWAATAQLGPTAEREIGRRTGARG